MNDHGDTRRLMHLPVDAVGTILRAAVTGRTSEEAATSLRSLGVASAAPIYALLRQRIRGAEPAELTAQQFWAELSGQLREMGWGSLHQEQLHAGVIGLSSSDWFEPAGMTSDHPCCHFTTGVLAELLRTVAESELAALEVECRSSGHSSCRFLVGSPAALEDIYEDMTRGGGYREALTALA